MNFFRISLVLLIILTGACHQGSKQGKSKSTPVTTSNEASVQKEPEAPNESGSASLSAQEKSTKEKDAAHESPRSTGRKQGKKSNAQTAPSPVKLTVQIQNPDLGLRFHLPRGWQQNGKTVKAFGRKGEWLNSEAVYIDSLQAHSLTVKIHPAPYAEDIWHFHRQQFGKHQGLFASYGEEIKVNGRRALYGISERRFDGKGHPLNPPAKVYAAVWYDPEKQTEYEMIFRSDKPGKEDESLFKSILKTVSTHTLAK